MPSRAGRPKIRVRPAGAADLATLVAHRRGMWQSIGGHSDEALDGEAVVYRRWARRMFSQDRLVAWIAEAPDGRPVGSGCLWFAEAQPRPGDVRLLRPYLLSMFTEPEFRGLGIASAIVREALAVSQRRGFRVVTLHASPYGRSVYRRLGFERTWEMRVRFDRPVPSRRPPRRRPSRARARSG